MSSLTQFNKHRQLNLNKNLLKKNKSIDTNLITLGSGVFVRSQRSYISALQKQFSIDDKILTNSKNFYNEITKAKHDKKVSFERTTKNDGHKINCKCGKKQNLQPSVNIQTKSNTLQNEDCEKPEEKVNLNIFLQQQTSTKDNETDYESLIEPLDTTISTIPSIKNTTSSSNPQTSESHLKNTQSAAFRRAQFRGNSINSKNKSIGSENNCPIVSASYLERRPPLIRAVSAPSRSFDEGNRNIFGNRKKSKKRKPIKRAMTIEEFQEHRLSNPFPLPVDSNNLKEKNKKIIRRKCSNFGCDVVTLVSLINLHGSDSELEETSLVPTLVASKCPPLLGKTGKSVSFQETEEAKLPLTSRSIFPKTVFRRCSIAPIAAKFRSNRRPPTAPAGSIFLMNNEKRRMEDIKNTKNDIKIETQSSISNFFSNKTITNDPNKDDSTFPDYIRTNKERDCWKLYQKMLSKDVTMSYDTILRGMLTPTELRHFEKRKDNHMLKELREQNSVDEKN